MLRTRDSQNKLQRRLAARHFRSSSSEDSRTRWSHASHEPSAPCLPSTEKSADTRRVGFVPFMRERDRMNRLLPTCSTKSSWNSTGPTHRKTASFDMRERDIEVSSNSEQSATKRSRFFLPAPKAALSDKFLCFLRSYDEARTETTLSQQPCKALGRPRFGLEYILYHGIAIQNRHKLLPQTYQLDYEAVDRHTPGFLFVKASKRASTLVKKTEYSEAIQLNPVAPQKSIGYVPNFAKLPKRQPLAQVTEYHRKSSDSLEDQRIKEQIQTELYSNMKIQDSSPR